MATHTPTPWKLNGLDIEVYGRGIVARTLLPASGGVMEAVANAAFIVTAVNSHDAMVAALTKIAELTQRKQLPLTSEINEVAAAALARVAAPKPVAEGE